MGSADRASNRQQEQQRCENNPWYVSRPLKKAQIASAIREIINYKTFYLFFDGHNIYHDLHSTQAAQSYQHNSIIQSLADNSNDPLDI